MKSLSNARIVTIILLIKILIRLIEVILKWDIIWKDFGD